MAVDAKAGIMATVARLDKVPKDLSRGNRRQMEFCIWNQADGTLARRWRSTKEEDAAEAKQGAEEQTTKAASGGLEAQVRSSSACRWSITAVC